MVTIAGMGVLILMVNIAGMILKIQPTKGGQYHRNGGHDHQNGWSTSIGIYIYVHTLEIGRSGTTGSKQQLKSLSVILLRCMKSQTSRFFTDII